MQEKTNSRVKFNSSAEGAKLEIYELDSYHRSNQDTSLLHKPALNTGEWVETGDLLADNSSSYQGELAIGKNILVAYMPWEGYNYEDSILINERLVYDDAYTSVHIERYEIEVREDQQGSDRITKEIPDIPIKCTQHLDSTGIAKLGSWIEEGDILVGKVTPINPKKQTGYQRLIYKLFDKKAYSVRDSSLRAPKGIKANVINVQILDYMEVDNNLKQSATKQKASKESKAQAKKGYRGLTPTIRKLGFAPYPQPSAGRALQSSKTQKQQVPQAPMEQGHDKASLVMHTAYGRPEGAYLMASGGQRPSLWNTKKSSKWTYGPSYDWGPSSAGAFETWTAQKPEPSSQKNNSSTDVPGSVEIHSSITGGSRAEPLTKLAYRSLIDSMPLKNNQKTGSELNTKLSNSGKNNTVPQLMPRSAGYWVNGSVKNCYYKNSLMGLTDSYCSNLLVKTNSTGVSVESEQSINKSFGLSGATPPSQERWRHTKLCKKAGAVGAICKVSAAFGAPAKLWHQETVKNQLTKPNSLGAVGPNKSYIPTNVHIYLAEKRKIQVGDKMAGRHGNKGIISNILPRQDMPYLPDGTALDIVLNPLGVPSRMNVGQIYECLLGLAGKYLGEHYKIFPFDEIYGAEASRSFVFSKLFEARKKTGVEWLFDPNTPGKIRIFDGRTSESFDQAVTVGVAYMLKLVHMVDDKIHMRSTGPYSLVTQQPLRGRAKAGGQRLGEMEVWAIEGYGAAFVLLEMLTLKSDDMTGRLKLWSDVILNKDIRLGTPESFKVLVCELQALCLDIGLYSGRRSRAGAKGNTGVSPHRASVRPTFKEITHLMFMP